MGSQTNLDSCQTNINSKPILSVSFRNLKLRFLIDTGSDVSIISESITSPLKMKFEPTSMRVSTLSGDSLRIFGITRLNFKINDVSYSWRFQISEFPNTMAIDGILGWDFLQTYSEVLLKCVDLPLTPCEVSTTNLADVASSSKSEKYGQDDLNFDDSTNLLAPLPGADEVVLPKEIDTNFYDLVAQYCDLFTSKIKTSKLGEFDIKLSTSTPVKVPPRRVPLHFIDKVTDMLKDYEEQGIIRRSQSPYCAPVVLVPKKTGDIRFACDYRRLNAVTIKDSGPISTFEEVRDNLQGSTIFSKFDLKSGYWQLLLATSASEKTAFSPGPQFGLWEWTVLPFGLSNAVSHFHREMTKAFRDLSFVTVYLDDIFIGSSDSEEHRRHLTLFFQRCSELNLTLSGAKCFVGRDEIEILGRVIGKNGIRMSKEKLNTISNWPLPSTKKQLMSFLGLCNYDSRFIKKFAELTAPLYQMTRCDTEFLWTEHAVDCFNQLKKNFTHDVCLVVPNTRDSFTVQTDASDVAISGVLLQNCHPVEFFSRKLKPSECHYSAIQKECLAIVCTLRKFRHYLIGRCFHLQTDHKPLIWLKQQKQNGMLGRWSIELQEYDFNITHIRRRDNILADSVSRQFVNTIQIVPHFSNERIRELQSMDPVLSSILESRKSDLSTPKLPDGTSSSLTKRWKQLYKQLVVQDDILWRRYKKAPEEDVSLLPIIPEDLQEEIIKMNHDPPHCGHLGVERTIERIIAMAYWPGLRRSVDNYISNCESCQVVKAKASQPPVQNFVNAASKPGELLTVDILKLPNDQGYNCILLIVDAFSKFPVAYKMKNETSKTIIKHLLSYFTLFGIPRRILTDQGPNLESYLVYETLKYFGVKKSRTAIYHPQTDGQTERMNRSILEMLRHYARNGKWVDNLDLVLMAYRSSINSVTGQTPSMLFFNRELPQAPLFSCDIPSFPSRSQWMDILDDVDLTKAVRKVPNTEDFMSQFEAGDQVLVRTFVRPHKLQSQFEPGWTITALYNGCAEVSNGRRTKVVNFCDISLFKKSGGNGVMG